MNTQYRLPERSPSVVAMFFDQANRFGERPFLWTKRGDAYTAQTWREIAARMCALARGLRTLGVERGDRIVIVSENRPAWMIGDLAIMAVGAITVPAYTTSTEDDLLYLLEHSDAAGAIVSKEVFGGRVAAAMRQIKRPFFLISLEPVSTDRGDSIDLRCWADIIAEGEADHTNIVEEASKLQRGDTACIIYTSGTSGRPKGVMLSHGALLHNCAGAIDALWDLGPDDNVFLSFLPLAHAYEHTAGQILPIALGAEIYYAEGIDKVARNMLEARPTLMTAVPRLYEVMNQRIMHGVAKAGPMQRYLFNKTLALGRKRLFEAKKFNILDRLVDAALDRLVRAKFRQRFGGRLKALISGGAPLNAEMGSFFTSLGVPIHQGYGQTEAAPLLSVNRPGAVKMHTVGPPIKGVEVRIADDGEILVRGEMVMQGYWRDQEATRDTIRNGWLHTGDIGNLDEDGHIVITDRKKDLIVNSGGDNISPAKVETALTTRTEIDQAMVIGDRRPYLVGIIVPAADWLQSWARQHGKPTELAEVHQDPDLHHALSQAVGTINEKFPIIERVRKFVVAPEAFTQENNMLTPTQKVRRHIVRERYGAMLEALYD